MNHRNIDASNSTCYLETLKTLININRFYYNEWKYFAFFLLQEQFQKYTILKVSKKVRRVSPVVTDIKESAVFDLILVLIIFL